MLLAALRGYSVCEVNGNLQLDSRQRLAGHLLGDVIGRITWWNRA